jgi:hypothetical protein
VVETAVATFMDKIFYIKTKGVMITVGRVPVRLVRQGLHCHKTYSLVHVLANFLFTREAKALECSFPANVAVDSVFIFRVWSSRWEDLPGPATSPGSIFPCGRSTGGAAQWLQQGTVGKPRQGRWSSSFLNIYEYV